MKSKLLGRRQVLTGGTALTFAGLGLSSAQAATLAATPLYDSPEGAQPLYGRTQLEAFVDRYLQALLAHDPTRAPFASGAVFAENNVRLPLGAASWKTIERLGRYRHYFADPEAGEAGLIANVYENGSGCILVLRLKIDNNKITEAEQYVTRDPRGADNYEKLGAPDPIWLESVPPTQRQSHDALRAVAFMYFEALQRNDGAGVYPFTADCLRLEHARQTVNLPRLESYGHADSNVTFTTLKAKAQYELGLMAFVTRIRDRRYLVVDVERGAVLANAVYEFDGALEAITFADGHTWKLPAYFRTPRANHGNEAFKILNGSFRYIEMTFVETPYGMRAAWSGRKPTVSLAYFPKPVRAPIEHASDRAALATLTERVVDAFVRHCPCELPLAADFRYTENGMRIDPGSGLWQSATRLDKYRIALADPEHGAIGWFGAMEERGLFAMVALRARIEAGQLTEMESIIARPQKPGEWGQLREATFTLFEPPLVADLDPAAFELPVAALLESTPQPRAAMAGAIDAYQQACETRDAPRAPMKAGAVRRDNGHEAGSLATSDLARLTSVRGRRSLVIDAARGLALELVLRDNAALERTAPAEFRSPWTDVHAQLFKIEGRQIAHLEELVRRLPYGHGSGWEA